MSVKTRFAPSPTGYLHIGGVRTALFCWLYARRHGGTFALRIEDTDRQRSTPESIDAILDGMRWVGLDWDEGPVFQSQRTQKYNEAVEQLLAADKAYACYCTPEELDAMRAEQQARGGKPRYDGRCRDRHEPRAGVSPAIRFKTPSTGEVLIDDLVRGPVTFSNDDLDDLVIRRSDGSPTYHLSVVVDDADMQITHVIRGDDHLNNTPRQVHLINALNLSTPVYAHLPMILGADGGRLSKRHGAVNVLAYRDQGYLPDAMLSYLVRLGWSHGDQEWFSRDDMIRLFDLGDVNASAARFDGDKLDWLNQQSIIASPTSVIAQNLGEQLVKLGVEMADGPPLDAVAEVYRERAVTFAELGESVRYLFENFDDFEPRAAKKHLRPVVSDALRSVRDRFAAAKSWSDEVIHADIQAAADDCGIGFGKLGQPLRVAVTGGGVSPPIDQTLRLVGKDRVLRRLDKALEFVASRAIDTK